MLGNLNSNHANSYKYPLTLSLCIFSIAGVIRWFTDYADDKVFVICIFMFLLFLSNHIGEKLRHMEDAANELCQDQDTWYTQPENTPPRLEPIVNNTVSTWWG